MIRMPRARRASQRGLSLLEAMIAVILLLVGMYALSKFQTKAIQAGSDAANRQVAAAYAEELASMAAIDTAANAVCYTSPQGSTRPTGCASNPAWTQVVGWLLRLRNALPSASAASVFDASTGQLKVRISWSGRLGEGPASAAVETRVVEVVTDVRN